MIKKGDNEIVALFKGDTEVEQLFRGDGTLIYDADRIYAYIEDNTLIIESDRHASYDDEDESLSLRNKSWGKAEFVNDNHKKIIKIQQHERE